MHIISSPQLILGMYICPLRPDGYSICWKGQKLSDIASENIVKEPVINAWEAIIAAAVAKITAGIIKNCGNMPKKGLVPVKTIS